MFSPSSHMSLTHHLTSYLPLLRSVFESLQLQSAKFCVVPLMRQVGFPPHCEVRRLSYAVSSSPDSSLSCVESDDDDDDDENDAQTLIADTSLTSQSNLFNF